MNYELINSLNVIRFVKKFKWPMLMLKNFIIFNVQYSRVLYKLEDFIFQANGIAGFVFLIILSELTDQCWGWNMD